MVDVSKNTVAILVVLVIIVSGFGTYTMLSEAASGERPSARQGSEGGKVGLAVQQPPKNNGYIKLDIGDSANG
jgi:hypothetical protein